METGFQKRGKSVMHMSEHEIIQMYKEAADKNAQIEILADLNVCSKQEILKVLEEAGAISGVKAGKKGRAKEMKPRKERVFWSEEMKEEARQLLREEWTVLQTAEKMGLDFGQVQNAVTRYKLRGEKETPHQSAAPTASPQGEAGEGWGCSGFFTGTKGARIVERGEKTITDPEQSIEPLDVVSLIRDYAKCITALPSADIRNYEKIVRTFAESIIEGADRIINFSAKEYGVPENADAF